MRRNASWALRSRPSSRRSDFFFQAEDGIRDLYVTGVQTCALPISWLATDATPNWVRSTRVMRFSAAWRWEERRVGKECRYRWSPGQLKKQTNNIQRAAQITFGGSH